ncbi:MAG: hypothetical protein K6F99_06050 [Lachnospiraceae bacterium]|nr:hypothetical protein [Lachnospiraceae bacterium]
MSNENIELNDDALEGAAGGRVTPGGYPVDKKGNVIFTDKTGQSLAIPAADWEWLKGQYNDPHPEQFMKSVPAKDIQSLVLEHNPKAFG